MKFKEKNKIYKTYCRRCLDYVDVLCLHPQNTQYYPFLICLKCGNKVGIAYDRCITYDK